VIGLGVGFGLGLDLKVGFDLGSYLQSTRILIPHFFAIGCWNGICDIYFYT